MHGETIKNRFHVHTKAFRSLLSTMQYHQITYILCEISDFRREVDENCAILGYQAASNSNPLPNFREKPTGCPETSVSNYHYTMRNNPEECSTHTLILHKRDPKHDHGYHKQVCYVLSNISCLDRVYPRSKAKP